ncbi:hypothetical protein [Pseudomonas oryzae]|uniref:hypothetical protein n=1 Tax=Pseudomonas oryzae TaxID=1392877 RepID=UPI0012FDF382|nr:hypothetical protein [Pseudomonas oryzae]
MATALGGMPVQILDSSAAGVATSGMGAAARAEAGDGRSCRHGAWSGEGGCRELCKLAIGVAHVRAAGADPDFFVFIKFNKNNNL